jgi:hypothetical protein
MQMDRKPELHQWSRRWYAGLMPALGYAFLAQLVIRHPLLARFDPLMSNGFLFWFPAAVGALTRYGSPNSLSGRWRHCVVLPWLAILLCLAAALMFRLEGLLSVILAAPIYFLMSSLGAAAMGLTLNRSRKTRLPLILLTCLLALPFVSAGIEAQLALPERITEVHTQILIAAQPEAVWPNITEVPEIAPQDSRFFSAVGLPKPVSASLSGEGVGGVRRAVYEGGYGFSQRILEWAPPRRFVFEFTADPGFALDRHVTIGGPYFDILKGTYAIEEIAPGKVRLHFTSTYRLSTRFNFYAARWTDFLLRRIQSQLLEIIKKNSEQMMK